MESQPPPVPCSATPTQHHQQRPSSNAVADDHEYTYNEKEPYQRQHSVRPDRNSKSSYSRAHDSVISSHPFSPKPSSPPSPCSSISSVGGQQPNSPQGRRYSPSEIDRQSIQYPPKAHLDPEKHAYSSSQGRRSPNRASATPAPDSDAIVYDKGAYHEKGPEEKAWHLLFWLCAPNVFLSGAIALWSLFAILISIVLAPLRLCTTRPPLSEQITAFLAPALNLQLHMVYSHDSTTGYSAPMLVVIHLFSPIVSFGVAIAAWTAAGFWFFSSILGDPGGHDGHNDGKESIVGVRNWWERWLSRGLRETNA
ncbi:hypothetical protein DDE82_002382 [Stemphylium lycopersici]|nr:hypothetical protein DDE82_002382 [Stemphylium lycopersici]